MKGIIKLIDNLSLFSSRLSAIFISISVVLIFSEIVSRVMFNSTIYITDEYSSYLMCAISFTAVAFTLKENSHIRMTFLLDTLKGKNKLILNIICNFNGFVFSFVLFYYTFKYFWDSVLTGSRSMTIAETYLAIPQFFMPLGCLLLIFQFLSEILKIYVLLVNTDAKIKLNSRKE